MSFCIEICFPVGVLLIRRTAERNHRLRAAAWYHPSQSVEGVLDLYAQIAPPSSTAEDFDRFLVDYMHQGLRADRERRHAEHARNSQASESVQPVREWPKRKAI